MVPNCAKHHIFGLSSNCIPESFLTFFKPKFSDISNRADSQSITENFLFFILIFSLPLKLYSLTLARLIRFLQRKIKSSINNEKKGLIESSNKRWLEIVDKWCLLRWQIRFLQNDCSHLLPVFWKLTKIVYTQNCLSRKIICVTPTEKVLKAISPSTWEILSNMACKQFQKRPIRGVLWHSCSEKIRENRRKTPVTVSSFTKVETT